MALVAVIAPLSEDKDIDARRWAELVRDHANLKPQKARRGLNPFSNQLMTIPPRLDAARVHIDGHDVGFLCWSERNLREIDVHALSDEPQRVLGVARAIAAALGASFYTLDDFLKR